MDILKKIIDFYIFSNIHVALAGFCFTKVSLLKFGFYNNLTPVFVGLSILISYNFIRYYEIKTSRLIWFKSWFFKHTKQLLILVVFAVLGLSYITFFCNFNLKSLVVIFPFAFMTLFYVVPLFKVGKVEISFRNYPAIKIFSIAIAWAGIMVFFPLVEVGYKFTSNVYLEFMQRILFVITITLPFDIRDVNVDAKMLKTLPQILGISNSKKMGYFMLFVFIGLEFIKEGYSFLDIYIEVLIAIIIAIFLGFSSPNRNRYYTSFWVEAIPIFWFALIMFFL